MAKLMQMKSFEPYQGVSDESRPTAAKMSSTHSKTFLAISLALRPCGVTAYEAAEQINALGGKTYTPGYTKSAQFAPSYYSQLGYGAFGKTETVGNHIAAVEAAAGKDEAEFARACLPESLQDDDTEVLVIYAFAAGGQAIGRYGQVVQSELPSSAEEAVERREALAPAKPSGSKSGGGRRSRSAKKKGGDNQSS